MPTPTYAAHVVAAAVTEAPATGDNVQQLFGRMLRMLGEMHDQNPSWGPLFVAHPGNIVRDMVYVRAEGATRETRVPPLKLTSKKLARRKESVSPMRRTTLRRRH